MAAVQASPPLRILASMAPSTALSRSASANTSSGALPPSSMLFWIIEAPDLDVALKLATEGSKACNRKVEVRPFL